MKLFEKTKLGSLQLQNRIVMAPMTRSRAIGNLPNDLMAHYYGARASAGLLITEGVAPSPNGLGYARIPGIFNSEQSVAWKKVTDSVHHKGGKIFLQMMHTGRVSHPANMPAGSRVLAPSTIPLAGKMWTDAEGALEHPAPEEMSKAQIKETIHEFAKAAELAIQAGFDGVEMHAANGYLLEQFSNPSANQRTDEYGGSAENRMRFVLEVANAVIAKIGSEKTGVRISPYGVFNGMGAFPGVQEFYAELSRKFSELDLVYIHVIDPGTQATAEEAEQIKKQIRSQFKGTYILSANYDKEKAEKDLQAQKGDLVAFGRPFLANPDLVEKLKEGRALLQPDVSKLYTPGPEGYTLLSS